MPETNITLYVNCSLKIKKNLNEQTHHKFILNNITYFSKGLGGWRGPLPGNLLGLAVRSLSLFRSPEGRSHR